MAADLHLSDLAGGICARPRCDFPIAGVGEPYRLCATHGREERNRRLAERDAIARPEPRAITRGLLTEPLVRPLSAVVGAPVTPTPIAPSACTAPEKTMPEPLTLRPNAGADPKQCRIDGCGTVSDARGLCKRHYAAARKAKRLEELAAPAQNVCNRRTKSSPMSPSVLRAERDRLREELAAARSEMTPVAAWVNGLIVRTRNVDFDTMRVDVEAALEDAEQNAATSDALVKARAECGMLRKSRDRLRHELEQIADALECNPTANAILSQCEAQVRSLTERANLFAALGFEPGADIGQVIARAKDLRASSMVTLRAKPEPEPATARHRVKQAGGRDLGELDGYVDDHGLFRATTGAIYGCLYSVEPVATPAPLPAPVRGVGVWVLTTVSEATADSVYLWNGGRLPRSTWTAEKVRPADARPTTFAASSAGDEDIPF